MVVYLKFDKKQFDKINRSLSKNNFEFAAALALSDIAMDAKEDLIRATDANMKIRKAWVRKGFRTRRAQKKDGLNRMFSAVGHTDWYMKDQLGDKDNIRTPKKAKWLWKPTSNAKRTKAWKVENVLKKKGVFVIHSNRGKRHAYICKRVRKELTVLYVGTKQQTINPKMSLRKETTNTYQRKFQRHFNKRMIAAMRNPKK